MYNKIMYDSPITYMNKKQLQNICRLENLLYSAITTQPELVALINA